MSRVRNGEGLGLGRQGVKRRASSGLGIWEKKEGERERRGV